MKIRHLGVFVLIISFALPCYASNKLKYKIADGDVVSMGSTPDIQSGAGERVVSVDFEIPQEPLNHFTFNGESLVRKAQPVIDKMEAEQNFSYHVLMGELNQTMDPMSILKLGPYTGVLQSMIDWKNWPGIKTFLGGMVQANIATAEEVALIKAAFAKQNIEIDTY